MGYVGNQTTNAFTSMDKQDITGNGGTSYTLSHAVANAQEIEVFVNNVRQEPAVAYTVSGTALSMTGNVTSTDDFYVVYQGKAVQTVVPPDGSVTSAKLDTNIAIAGTLSTVGSVDINKNSASPADNDVLGALLYTGKSSTGADKTYSSMNGFISNVANANAAGGLIFNTRNSDTLAERMRLDGSNLLVAKNSDAYATAGFRVDYRGFTQTTRDGNTIGYFNRLTSDGPILEFSKDSGNVGNIQTKAGFLSIGTGVTGLLFAGSENAIEPHNISTQSARDNAIDLGASSVRFQDIFATNGTIQTSDANEKQQIAALTDAEMTAAKAISQLFKTFKWNDSVAEKGDAARTHTGVIAQDVQAAMTAAGLDAGDYAFFISTTWWETQTEVPAVEAVDEVLDDDGNVVTEAVEAVAAYTRTDTYETAEEAPEGATERTRLGIRYPELLAFVGAATEQRLGDIETRLAALEAS